MISFDTITDEDECRRLWEAFSKKQTIWDLWDFRACFHSKDFDFNFIAGKGNGNLMGVLPLVIYKPDGSYTYFGDDFPEQNKFLLKDKKNLHSFLDKCPKETEIYYISSEEAKHYNFSLGDRRYFLNLLNYGSSFENFLRSFNKKHRKNLSYDLRKLEKSGYTTEKNKIEDFKRLIALNRQMFGSESNYWEEEFISSMKKLIKIAAKKKILDLISVKIDSKAEAVGLGIAYNGIYSVLGSGRNIKIKNLGKVLVAEQIKSAIAHKCREIDFLATESSWKELWNFESEQMYEFRK